MKICIYRENGIATKKAARSEVLLELAEENGYKFREYFVGREIEVLLEEQKIINGKSYMVGHTKEYVQVALETNEDMSNQIVSGTAAGFLTKDILWLKFSDR